MSHVWHQLVPQNTTQNPDSPLPPCTPLLHPSAMTLTPSESSNKSSINSIGPNEDLPKFADIARDIQNRASRCIGSESTEARLFREFFGTSVRVVEILWDLVVCNKLQPRGGAPGASALDVIFYEGVPQAGPGLLGRWRICRRRRPEDPPQMGMGLHQGHRQACGRGGE